MKLIVFHQVLIGSAVLFFFGYGAYELFLFFFPPGAGGSSTGGGSLPLASGGGESLVAQPWEDRLAEAGAASLLTGVLMIAGGAALSVYLAWLVKRYKGQTAGF